MIAKKKQALLHFLKTGESQDGGLKESQEASNSKTTNELFEWVPWKQVLDWYGEEEALDRVENGSLPVRKEQKKWYEFLLIKKSTALTLKQRQLIVAEQSIALKGAELKACKKALQAPRTEEEWQALWAGKKAEKGFEVKDALSEESSTSSDPEESQSSPEEVNPAVKFLKGLKEGRSQASKTKPAEDKRNKKDAEEIKARQRKEKAQKKRRKSSKNWRRRKTRKRNGTKK